MRQLINFYQIVVVMPTVYSLPPLPDWYMGAMRPFTWIDLNWTQYVLPGACIGYRERLLLRGLGPLLLLAALPLGYGLAAGCTAPVPGGWAGRLSQGTTCSGLGCCAGSGCSFLRWQV